MVWNRALSSRRLVLVCAAATLLASAGAQAQMTAGGVIGMQAVQAAQNPGTVMTTAAQPTSTYSNPYSNNGVANSTARPTINGQGDPYAPSTTQGAQTGDLGRQSGRAGRAEARGERKGGESERAGRAEGPTERKGRQSGQALAVRTRAGRAGKRGRADTRGRGENGPECVPGSGCHVRPSRP